jgi:hypothetical protein
MTVIDALNVSNIVSEKEMNPQPKTTYNIVNQFENCSNKRPHVLVYRLWVLIP